MSPFALYYQGEPGFKFPVAVSKHCVQRTIPKITRQLQPSHPAAASPNCSLASIFKRKQKDWSALTYINSFKSLLQHQEVWILWAGSIFASLHQIRWCVFNPGTMTNGIKQQHCGTGPAMMLSSSVRLSLRALPVIIDPGWNAAFNMWKTLPHMHIINS